LIPPATLRASALPALRVSMQQQRRGARGGRALAPVYRLLEALKQDGLEFESMRGPWRVGREEPPSGRLRRASGEFVELGRARIRVDSDRRARELAGLLNWCGVSEEDLSGG
jgi:hypothetical protein